MSDIHELQLRLAELHRLRDEYAARPRRDAMTRYVDTLIADLETRLAESGHGVGTEVSAKTSGKP